MTDAIASIFFIALILIMIITFFGLTAWIGANFFNTNVSYHGKIIARPNTPVDTSTSLNKSSSENIENIRNKRRIIIEILKDKNENKLSKLDRITKLKNESVISYQEYITLKYDNFKSRD